MSLIGIHVSRIDDIMEIVENYPEFKQINLIQIFVSATTDYTVKKYRDMIKYLNKKKINLVVHASYSINLANRWSDSDWWIQQFIGEIKAAADLNAFGIVIHTGKQLQLSTAEALNNMYTSLLHIHHETTTQQNVRILIETPSGQGTETLVLLQDFCRFMKKFYTHPDEKIRERFGVCMDTCHVFAAGNDIRTEKDMNHFFGSIDRSIGITKIKLCHINDSKKGLGEHLDRHATIGEGEIGSEAIKRVVKFMKELGVPIIVETPDKNMKDDYEFIKLN